MVPGAQSHLSPTLEGLGHLLIPPPCSSCRLWGGSQGGTCRQPGLRHTAARHSRVPPPPPYHHPPGALALLDPTVLNAPFPRTFLSCCPWSPPGPQPWGSTLTGEHCPRLPWCLAATQRGHSDSAVTVTSASGTWTARSPPACACSYYSSTGGPFPRGSAPLRLTLLAAGAPK